MRKNWNKNYKSRSSWNKDILKIWDQCGSRISEKRTNWMKKSKSCKKKTRSSKVCPSRKKIQWNRIETRPSYQAGWHLQKSEEGATLPRIKSRCRKCRNSWKKKIREWPNCSFSRKLRNKKWWIKLEYWRINWPKKAIFLDYNPVILEGNPIA